ncbi:MAG: STAS domain-containing protein [Syntrophobacteraceae bacterium]|nr:STAS domain-containing protein [Desulfobacteraceae bacterium]
MSNSKDSSELSRVLALEGALTVQRIGELKEMISLALSESDEVVLNVENAAEIDLSFLQLLCAAHKSASHRNKHLLLGARQPPCLRQAKADAGILPLEGCCDAFHKDCLWKGADR